MALTFPLALSQFANVLAKTSVKFWLADNVQSSGLASGQLIVADLAPKYWAAEVGMINMDNATAMGVQALVESLDGGLNDFYLYDPRCAFPQYDPDGSILGASTVTNSNVDSAKQMDFTGFPVGYVLTPGDMFCFDYGSGNAYRALHRVVVGGTAGVGGNLTNVEFRPFLADPTLSTGKTMTFRRPSARMKLIPGSFEPGTAKQTMTTGMSFKCRQVH